MDKQDKCYEFYYSLRDYPEIIYQVGVPYPIYDLEDDLIYLPRLENQPYQQEWSAIAHELTHRQLYRYRGKPDIQSLDDQNFRGFTELIAEIGACLLCREMKIYQDTKDAHIRYIKGWKNLLTDKTLLKHCVGVAIKIIGDLLQKKLYRLDVPPEIRCMFLGR